MKRLKRKLMASSLIFAMLLSAIGAIPIYAEGDETGIDWWIEDALDKVRNDATIPQDPQKEIVIDMAKHDYEAQDIVVRSTEEFHISGVEFSDLTSGENTISRENLSYNFLDYVVEETGYEGIGLEDYKLYPDSNEPDPISNDLTRTVSGNTTQPIYITVYAPTNTVAGLYEGTATVNTDKGNISVPMQVTVYDTTVPDVTEVDYTVYNWVSDMGYSFQYTMNAPELYYDVEAFTPEWWDLMDDWTDDMIEHRQNMYLVNTPQLLLHGGSVVNEDGSVEFDFSLLDQWLDFLIEKGFTKFGGMHLAFHWDGVDPDKYPANGATGALVRNEAGETVFGGEEILNNPSSDYYMEQYLSELAEYLFLKKMPDGTRVLDVWYQHVFDEPNYSPNGLEKWGHLADLVHEHGVVKDPNGEIISSMKTLDADANGIIRNYEEKVDVWVPVLDMYESNKNFYDAQKADGGDEVYGYVCVAPGGGYLNRFTYLPNLTGQIMNWFGYEHDLDGILHWAWNVWTYGNGENASVGRGTEGDTCIVYPDAENMTVKGSLRNEAMRDGLEDYTLLQNAEEHFGRDAAIDIVDAVVTTGHDYMTDAEEFRVVRKALLMAASGDDTYLTVLDGGVVEEEEIPIVDGDEIINNSHTSIKYYNADGVESIEKGQWESDDSRSNWGWEAYENDVHFTNGNGYYMEVPFTGTGVEVYAEKNPDQGEVKIEILDEDDQVVEDITASTKSESEREFIQSIGSIMELPLDKYTLRITNMEAKYFTFDAVVIHDYIGETVPGSAQKVNNNDPAVNYVGAWGSDSNRGDLGLTNMNGDAHYSNVAGSYVEFTFYGTDITAYFEQNSDQGKCEVYVDDIYVKEIDTYAPSRSGANPFVLMEGLSLGEHTVRIVISEDKYVPIDAFEYETNEEGASAKLWKEIASHTSKSENQYEQAGWLDFETALQDAIDVMLQDNPSDSDYEAARDALVTAVGNLIQLDRVDLDTEDIEIVKGGAPEDKQITLSGVTEDNQLVEISNGNQVLTEGVNYSIDGETLTLKSNYLYNLSNGDYTFLLKFSANIDKSFTVNVSGEALVTRELAGYIVEAGMIEDTEGLYTTASWSAMMDALDAAKEVYEAPASQAAIDQATEALKLAINNLEHATDVEPPVISHPGDVTIVQGDDFDPMQGVTAVDVFDGVLTNEIEITGAVDTQKADIYELTYTVEDESGNQATAIRKIEVVEASIATEIEKLQTLYNTVSKENERTYTAASWEIFEAQVNEAKMVLEKEAPEFTEVNNVRKSLQEAFDGLVERESTDIFLEKNETIVNDSDSAIVYSPEVGGEASNNKDWARDPERSKWGWAAIGDDLAYSQTSGNSFAYTFEGIGIDVYVEKNPGQGRLDIEITNEEGAVVATGEADTNSPMERMFAQKAYTSPELPNGTYTLKATVNQDAGQYTSFDAFVVRTESITMHTVAFDTNGGIPEVIASQEIEGGEQVSQPENPSKSGHVFAGWYEDGADMPFDFGKEITGAVSLTAKWAPMEQVATPIITPEPGTYNQAQEVAMATATAGAMIYYTTDGSEPSQNSIQYTGAIKIASDTTIKAIAIKDGMKSSAVMTAGYKIRIPEPEVKFSVSFDTNGGMPSTIASQEVVKWKQATKPIDPTRQSYSFVGWYEAYSDIAFDFELPIISDVNLVARWEPVDTGTDNPGTDNPGTDNPGTGNFGSGGQVTIRPNTSTPSNPTVIVRSIVQEAVDTITQIESEEEETATGTDTVTDSGADVGTSQEAVSEDEQQVIEENQVPTDAGIQGEPSGFNWMPIIIVVIIAGVLSAGCYIVIKKKQS